MTVLWEAINVVNKGSDFCREVLVNCKSTMSINVKKYERELLDAYNDVLNDKTDTNW